MKLRNFVKKCKCLNLGPIIPYLGIFGLEFENNIAIFEISTLEFVKLRNFVKKWKCVNLGQKNALFGYFGAIILKKYCHIWNLEFENNIAIFEIRTREISWSNENAYVWKWKCLNLALKMPCLDIFRLEF